MRDPCKNHKINDFCNLKFVKPWGEPYSLKILEKKLYGIWSLQNSQNDWFFLNFSWFGIRETMWWIIHFLKKQFTVLRNVLFYSRIRFLEKNLKNLFKSLCGMWSLQYSQNDRFFLNFSWFKIRETMWWTIHFKKNNSLCCVIVLC